MSSFALLLAVTLSSASPAGAAPYTPPVTFYSSQSSCEVEAARVAGSISAHAYHAKANWKWGCHEVIPPVDDPEQS